MSNMLLESLLNETLQIKGSGSTVESSFLLLLRSPEVGALEEGYGVGTCSADEIRRFVNQLLSAHPGIDRFPYEATLAAIAIALRRNYSSFAHEYLEDLAGLKNSRFLMARRIAAVVLNQRLQKSTTSRRSFDWGTEKVEPPEVALRSPSPTTTQDCRATVALSGTAA